MIRVHTTLCTQALASALGGLILLASPFLVLADDIDTDSDGVFDSVDNCLNVANPTQSDRDSDTVGDLCDNAPDTSNQNQADVDGDKVGDVADNCPMIANSGQDDDDHDGIGNACDQYMCTITGAEVNGDSVDNDCDGFVDNASGDVTPPSGYVNDPSVNGDVSGANVGVNVVTEDSESLVKNTCLYYGVAGPETLIACKTNSERDWYSYDYAPSFSFVWNTTAVSDGAYKLMAIITDNANNTFTTPSVSTNVHNTSVGTKDNPLPISSCQGFQDVQKHASWYYTLTGDIDCTDFNWTSITNFKGTIDGKGHVVKNLSIDTQGNSGIFADIQSEGVLTGIHFWNTTIDCGSTYCGGISNTNWGKIEKSSIQGTMVCSGKCGGFASQNSGIISRSYAELAMTGNLGYAGLIAGQNFSGHIENCYAKGSTVASSGGNAGGLIGLNERWINYGDVVNSYAAVSVSDPGENGGLIGWQYQGGAQSNSYWDTDISGHMNMCGSTQFNDPSSCSDANGLTTAQMNDETNFSGWDFEDIWALNPLKNDGYPFLRSVTEYAKDTIKPVITLLGDSSVSITKGETYTDAGATAQDDVDGELTDKIVVSGSVDTNTIGEYTLTYTVSDHAGNSATLIERTVSVVEKKKSHSSSGSRVRARNTNANISPVGVVLGAEKHVFTMNLWFGSFGYEVFELQKRLRAEGFFTYPTDTGYFGPLTKNAVMAYQLAHNITPQYGFFGPLTRNEMNK